MGWTPVRNAVGLTSARTVRARRDEPGADVAAMDGYAVRIAGRGSAHRFRVRADRPRGTSPQGRLGTDEAVVIATGARLPPGANAVARQEIVTTPSEGTLLLRHPLRPGVDVHRRGEDLRRGSVLLRPGEVVRPFHLGILIAQGFERIATRRIRATVLTIGDELARPGDRNAGRIQDSLSPLIRSLAPLFLWRQIGPLPDDPATLRRALRAAARNSDLIVTIGGTSVGPHDYTKAAVASAGRLLFSGVRVNVLKRGGVGEVAGVPVVLLPGQVVSAVVVWHEYGRAVTDRMLGRPPRPLTRVALARPLANPHPMDSVYLFRVDGGKARPCRWGVRLLSELVGANAFGIVPRHATMRAGAMVEVRWLDGAS